MTRSAVHTTVRTIVRSVAAACALLAMPALPAHAANNINLSGTIAQTQFDDFVAEAGYAIAYNPMAPAEPEGFPGFHLGASVSTVKISESVWAPALNGGSGNVPSYLPVPRLQARVGLPFGIDLGVSRTSVPSSNISVTGGEVRKSLLGGNTALPAISVVLHGSKLSGVQDIDLSTLGAGLGVSKGFLIFTPYLAVDAIQIKGSENSALVTLADAKSTVTRGQLGVRMTILPFVSLTLQAESALAGGGNNNTYSIGLSAGI